jgi:uncharacterized tellurite resistance protein B-like protein
MYEAYDEQERRAFCRAAAGVVVQTVSEEAARVAELLSFVQAAGVEATEQQVRRQLEIAGEHGDEVFRHVPEIQSVGLQVIFLRTMVDALDGGRPLEGEGKRWVQSVAAAFGLDAAVPEAELAIDVEALNDFQRVMCVRAIARVILADGVVEDSERSFLSRAIQALGFALDDPRVVDILASERRRPTPVAELAEVLDHDGTRMPVLRAMLQASCVDDDLHDEEVVLIRRVAEALGIPSDVAVHMIDWARDWLVSWRH